MRVLHVLNELRPSGAETMLHSAAKEWQTHGVEAEILAVASGPGPFADSLRAVGYQVGHVPDDPLHRVPLRLLRKVRNGGYDIVHLHAERGNFWLGLAARAAGAAVVRTVHNNFAFRGRLGLERTLQRGLLRLTGSVTQIAVAPGVADNERRRFRNRVGVVDNWCDPQFVPPRPSDREAARAALGIDGTRPVLVSVGNCSPAKRHEAVFAALAHPLCPSDAVYLHVGAETAGREEHALAVRLGVADRVRFLGCVPPLSALHAADVFVMPSVHEGLPISGAEALATGLPAVLADAPGLRDFAWAAPAVTFAGTEPAELASAIAAAVQGRGREGTDLSAQVRERYGVRRGVAQYAAVYRTLLR